MKTKELKFTTSEEARQAERENAIFSGISGCDVLLSVNRLAVSYWRWYALQNARDSIYNLPSYIQAVCRIADDDTGFWVPEEIASKKIW